MASDNLNNKQIHNSYLNKLITYKETLFSNITDKIIDIALPPIKYYKLFVKRAQQDQQDKPISTGFYILLTILIIALVITSYWAYKNRCKRSLNGHAAIVPILKIKEENQNNGQNVLNGTNERKVSFEDEMMQHNKEVKINDVVPETEPLDVLGDRTTSDREIEQDLNATIGAAQANRNANQGQTNANRRQKRKIFVPMKTPVWRL